MDAGIEFNEDAHVTAIFPHTHVRGKSWDYRLIYPDGRKVAVAGGASLRFPELADLLRHVHDSSGGAERGSRLESTAHYDNAPSNPSNPDPKVEVHWGDQTWEEMQYTGITYTVDRAAKGSLQTAEQH